MIKENSHLTDRQKAQVAAQFSATSLLGKTFDDYVYEITETGFVISRKTREQHDRDSSVLTRRGSNGILIEGWLV